VGLDLDLPEGSPGNSGHPQLNFLASVYLAMSVNDLLELLEQRWGFKKNSRAI